MRESQEVLGEKFSFGNPLKESNEDIVAYVKPKITKSIKERESREPNVVIINENNYEKDFADFNLSKNVQNILKGKNAIIN